MGFGASGMVWGSEPLCGVRRAVLQIMGFRGQKCGACPPSLPVRESWNRKARDGGPGWEVFTGMAAEFNHSYIYGCLFF